MWFAGDNYVDVNEKNIIFFLISYTYLSSITRITSGTDYLSHGQTNIQIICKFYEII